jgi:glycosyltransferase involved in cell wall biosynthesis
VRIAYLCADRGIALGGSKGAAVHMASIVTALARCGAEVLLLPSSVVGGAHSDLPPDVSVDPLPEAATDAALADLLEERLSEFGAEALYERFSLHTAAGAAAAGRLGIPYLVELNAPLPEEAARYRSLERPLEAERLEREVLSSADSVLAVTGPLARYARERGAMQVEVFPNAVDPALFRRYSNLREPNCVFLGALRPWHGVDAVAEGWRLLGREAPDLLVVGDGPGRTALEAVGAKVIGAVPHREVPALLASASIGLAPYAADAPGYFSPLKLFEYLAAGLAVVAGAIEGVREVVGHEHVVLASPGDPVALAEAVRTLAADEPMRARLGSAGRELVAAHHTWERRARRILALSYRLQPATVR